LLPTVKKLAQDILKNSPNAVIAAKKALRTGSSKNLNLEQRLNTEKDAFSGLFGSHDQKEGTQAFMEKKKTYF
jgi:enoyl-CoA hydratase/carnithine racemase